MQLYPYDCVTNFYLRHNAYASRAMFFGWNAKKGEQIK